MNKKKKSPLWNHFVIEISDTNARKARCRYCSAALSFEGGNSGNLTRHLKAKHPTISWTRPTSSVEVIREPSASTPQTVDNMGKEGIVQEVPLEMANEADVSIGVLESIVSVEGSEEQVQVIRSESFKKRIVPLKRRLARRQVQKAPSVIRQPNGLISRTQKDEYATYGEHVANMLRKLSEHSRAIAQHKINTTLFEAEMGAYNTYTIEQITQSGNIHVEYAAL